MSVQSMESGTDLRELMKAAGLGHTFGKMTFSALRKSVATATTNGEPSVKRGRTVAALELPRSILAVAESGASTVTTQADPGESTSTTTLITPVATVLRNKFRSRQTATAESKKRAQVTTSADGLPNKRLRLQASTSHLPAEIYPEKPTRVEVATDGAPRILPSEHILNTDEDAFEMERLRRITAREMHEKERQAIKNAHAKAKQVAKALNDEEAAAERSREQEIERPGNQATTEDSATAGVEVLPQADIEPPESSHAEVYDVDQQAKIEHEPDHISRAFWSGRADVFTAEMKNLVKELASRAPPYLYHVHSTSGRRHTRGSASQNQMAPAAVVEGKPLYNSIYDFPRLSDLIHNFGNRILWQISKVDQFSSYTNSLLFTLVHAIGRQTRGETGITISILDTRKAQQANGTPAEFYYVPELIRIAGVIEWNGWGPMNFNKLLSPWYTHEFVAHGSFNLPDAAYRQVPLDELLAAGLDNFAPSFQDDEDTDQMRKLATRIMHMPTKDVYEGPAGTMQFMIDLSTSTRAREHTRMNGALISGAQQKAVTMVHLEQAATLARLFSPATSTRNIDAEDQGNLTAHFKIFIDLVALSNHKKRDRVFIDYILTHFTHDEVQDILWPTMTNLPNNLPESMHVLHRIREACTVLGVAQPGTNQIGMVDMDFDFRGRWHGNWARITSTKGERKPKVVKIIDHAHIDEDEDEDEDMQEDTCRSQAGLAGLEVQSLGIASKVMQTTSNEEEGESFFLPETEKALEEVDGQIVSPASLAFEITQENMSWADEDDGEGLGMLEMEEALEEADGQSVTLGSLAFETTQKNMSWAFTTNTRDEETRGLEQVKELVH
ncbi:hypothetical protein LTR62_001742 [Meristemomyces frigidus]|uniref:Uncharacterized protein n=1 Tax=Meristemomyces frigidus TaxID=1508187 RepID=A0AAN7TJZ9_9PEZI|nr:hypothetical protein LTR62_001742 [Meristemomyces frigidus]